MRTLLILLALLSVMVVACSAPIVEEPVPVEGVEGVVEGNSAEINSTPTTEPIAQVATTAPAATAEPTATATPDQTPEPFVSSLPNLGKAPDIRNTVWLNSDPMTLSDNLGKVVLVEFWTYT